MNCSEGFDPVRYSARNKICAEESDVFQIWQKHLDPCQLLLSTIIKMPLTKYQNP